MTSYPYSAYGPNPYSGNVNSDNGWGSYKWPGGVPGSMLTSFGVPAAGGTAHLTFRSELVELVRLSFQIAAKHGYPIYAVHNGEVWGPWSYENRAISGSNTASNHSRGRAWDINAPCLAAGTQVVTPDGPMAIETLVGHEVEVLTTNGSPLGTQEPVWRKTTFRSYGVAPTFDVVLSRRGTRTTVRTTADHRWFTHREHQGRPGGRAWREVKTSELGGLTSTERVLSAEYPPLTESLDPTAVARGIVWGDGNVGNANRLNPVSVVELVGDKYLDLRKWLDPHVRSWHNGTVGLRAWGLPLEWKRELPDPGSAVSVLAGFTAGWLATDGTVSTGGQVSVSTSDERAVTWLLRIAPRIGLCVSTVKHRLTTGYGGKANTEVLFTPRSVSVDLLIRPHHRERFTGLRRDATLAGWGVESVTPTGISEEVFCATVDGSGAFALHTGGVPLLTGNSNPYHDPLISDIPPAMVHDFEAIGWAWGGRYSGRKDAMHFEFGYAPGDVARFVAKAKAILGGVVVTPPDPGQPPVVTPSGNPFLNQLLHWS